MGKEEATSTHSLLANTRSSEKEIWSGSNVDVKSLSAFDSNVGNSWSVLSKRSNSMPQTIWEIDKDEDDCGGVEDGDSIWYSAGVANA